MRVNSGNGLLSISINQDTSCLSIGTPYGYRIYSVEPGKKVTCLSKREPFHEERQGFSIVEMLYKSNLMALVGTNSSKSGTLTANKIGIWDDAQAKFLFEIEFNNVIVAVQWISNRWIQFKLTFKVGCGIA
jgi:autophagy-related protein 18